MRQSESQAHVYPGGCFCPLFYLGVSILPLSSQTGPFLLLSRPDHSPFQEPSLTALTTTPAAPRGHRGRPPARSALCQEWTVQDFFADPEEPPPALSSYSLLTGCLMSQWFSLLTGKNPRLREGNRLDQDGTAWTAPSESLNPGLLPLESGWRHLGVMGQGGVQGIVVHNWFC